MTKKLKIQMGGRPDNFQTPIEALNILLPYLKKNWLIWECAWGKGNLYNFLKEYGFKVIGSDKEFDFLTGCKGCDCIVTNPPYCYDSKTEVLTKDGWKLISKISQKDFVMSLKPISLEIEWDKIKSIFMEKYQGKMIRFKSKYVDLLVTPEHRMYLTDEHGKLRTKKNIYGIEKEERKANENSLISAKEINQGGQTLIRGFKWTGKQQKYFILPPCDIIFNREKIHLSEIKIDIKIWLAFFGLWLAEGSVRGSNGGKRKNYGINIKQKEPKSKDVKKLLKKLPFKINEYEYENRKIHSFEINNYQLWNYLKKFGNSHQKFIPENIKDLDTKLLNILKKWYLFGDGTKSKAGFCSFYTVSRRLKDDLMEIFVKTGELVCCNNKIGKYRVGIHKVRMVSLNNKKYNIKSEEIYNGTIHCLELQKNSILLIRRNGKPMFSGNSLKDKFLARCYELKKPFALLMPLTALEGKKRGELYRKYGIQLIIPNKRINFETPSGDGSGAWFQASWFTWGLNLPKDLMFVKLDGGIK